MSLEHLHSITKIPKAGGATLLLCIVWTVGSSLAAAAQATTYSADSLMAAFQNGSSLKGTAITFTAVVAEIKKSRVTFKGPTNGKIVCELVSSIHVQNAGLSVGSPLTVVGKVRGRGLLGNVTIDECSLAGSVAVSNEHPRARPEEPERLAEGPKEQRVETPVVDAPPRVAAKVPATRIRPARPAPATKFGAGAVRPSPSESEQPRSTATATKTGAGAVRLAERPSPSEPEQPRSTATECEQRDEVVNKDSGPATGSFPVAFPAFAGLLVGLCVHFAFLKLRPALAAVFRPSSSGFTTEEARRVALEKLLLGQKKER